METGRDLCRSARSKDFGDHDFAFPMDARVYLLKYRFYLMSCHGRGDYILRLEYNVKVKGRALRTSRALVALSLGVSLRGKSRRPVELLHKTYRCLVCTTSDKNKGLPTQNRKKEFPVKVHTSATYHRKFKSRHTHKIMSDVNGTGEWDHIIR